MPIENQANQKKRQASTYYRDREHLSADEILALLEAAGSRGKYRERDSCLLLMMFRHGLRATEAASLKWDAVDLKSKTMKVSRSKKSIGGDHPLQPDEIQALSTLRKIYPDSDYVFPAERGGHLSISGMQKMFTRIAQEAGLEVKIHSHMMRSSCAGFLLAQGVPIQDIQAWLGHVNLANTIGYLPVTPNAFAKFNWDWSQDK